MTSAATSQGVLPRLLAHRPMYVRIGLPSRCCIRSSENVSQAGGAYRSRSRLLFQHVWYLKPAQYSISPLFHWLFHGPTLWALAFRSGCIGYMSPQRGQNVLHVANISATWRLYPESKIGFFVQKLIMFNFWIHACIFNGNRPIGQCPFVRAASVVIKTRRLWRYLCTEIIGFNAEPNSIDNSN